MKYIFRGTEGKVRIAVSIIPIGGRTWTPNLVVHHRDGNMPGDSLEIQPMQLAQNTDNLSQAQTAKQLPTEFALHQNYPNPFNPSTQINFDLPEAGEVSLVIYDVLGREIANLAEGYQEAGYHSATWNAAAASIASGVYFARFTVTNAVGEQKYAKINKLVLMK